MAAITYDSTTASPKLWHRRLIYPSYANLKYFIYSRKIDIRKFQVD